MKSVKYGLMIIAVVMLTALAFAGFATAYDATYTSNQWNALASAPTSGSYMIIDGTEPIYPKNLGSNPLMLTNDLSLDFSGYTSGFFGNVSTGIGNVGALFGYVIPAGHTLEIVGLNMTSVNVSLSTSNKNYVGGILGYVGLPSGGSGTLNITNCHLTDCNITGALSSSNYAGCLVGYADSHMGGVIVNVDTCTVQCCNVVTSGINVGGMVGMGYCASFVNCTVSNCVIASTEGTTVGGLAGGYSLYSGNTNEITGCHIENCSISGKEQIGGLVGYISNPLGSGFSSIMNECRITNCIISAGGVKVGGILGSSSKALSKGIMACHVENCVIASSGNQVGGLVGFASTQAFSFKPVNWLNTSAVRGSGDLVGEVVGSDAGTAKHLQDYTADGNVTNVSTPTWLNNGSSTYPQIIIAKSTVSASQGPENSTYFNSTTADTEPPSAERVTRLTGYGQYGQYKALAYVIEGPFRITNTTYSTYGSVLSLNATTAAIVSQALKGETIHVVAVNTIGYHFDGWNVTNRTGPIAVDAGGNFTMPATAVNAGANFTGNITTVVFFNETSVNIGSWVNTYHAAKNLTGYVPVRTGYTPWWNVSESGKPLTDSIYVTGSTWTYAGDNGSILHAYVNWTKNSHSVSTPSSSSSRHAGSSLLLPETVIPTIIPTGNPIITSVNNTTITPVSRSTQTSRSLVPFAGIIAGLGIASLVLGRRRQ